LKAGASRPLKLRQFAMPKISPKGLGAAKLCGAKRLQRPALACESSTPRLCLLLIVPADKGRAKNCGGALKLRLLGLCLG
jgi:hypothetical protein